MNGWADGVTRALVSIASGSAAYATQQPMSGGQKLGSVYVAFVSTDSMVAQQAFSVAVAAAAAAAAWLLSGLVVYLIRKAVDKQRGKTSPSRQK